MGWIATLTLAAALLAGPHHEKPDIRIQSAWLALGVGSGGAAGTREVRAKLGEDVRAYLVVRAKVDGKRRLFSTAPRLRKGRRRVRRFEAWPSTWPQPTITWYKLEADPLEDGVYDNTGTMEKMWHPIARADHPAKWHWCEIDYAETDTKWGSVWQHRVDAHPTTTPDEYGGLGTMRFVAKVQLADQTIYTRGKEHRDKAGLKPGIATVRFRRDDTAVGYMTELINLPYVYGSSSPNGKTSGHQAERGVGADCADLVVYGWRRAGRKKQRYTWTGGLKGMTKRRAWVDSLKGGRYRTADGRPIAFGKQVRVGDILLWGRHVAVIATKDPTGYLTPDTEIVHTVIESAALIPLKKIGFGFDTPPFDLRRR